MVARSKWHHYVPQGVLKRFCYESRKIYFFSKNQESKGVCSRDISKKFRKRHYYSIKDSSGERTDILESKFLQVLDSRFSEFIDDFQRIVSDRKTPSIDFGTRQFLQQFVYYYAKRNPDFVRGISVFNDAKAEVEDALDQYEALYGKISNRRHAELLHPDKITSIFDYARVKSLAQESPEVTAKLDRMSLHFAFAPIDEQFIVGSNPVVRFENKKGAILGDGNVEIWTPMTPKILIGFGGPGVGSPMFLELSSKDVQKINVQMFKQSTEVASVSSTLVSSLMT